MIGNNTRKDLIGVYSDQLKLRSGHTLILHDVLYLLGFQYTRLSIVALVGLDFTLALVA